MTECKKQKVLAITFWVLTAVCFGIIFYFSSRSASSSSEQSTFVIRLIRKLFGAEATSFFVRKFAHFLEYTGTALIMSAAFYYTLNKNRIYLPIAFTSLYAVSDEIHQIFVEGRSCELRDWAIDTLGAILGAVIFTLILTAVKKMKDIHTRRKNK